MIKRFDTETIKTTEYICSFKDFDDTRGFTWDEAYCLMSNFNASNLGQLYKFAMKQGRKDENGFYPNFLQIIPSDDCHYDIDEMLTYYGYNFNKHDITLQKIFIDYDSDVDEFVMLDDTDCII